MRAPEAYFAPEPRLKLMDELGIDASLMWPTLASVLEERVADDPLATHAVIHALPLADRRGGRALVDRGVRVPQVGRRLLDGKLDAPQKKNPDIAELARGKSGRLIGHLTGLLATLKALPLAYNRDLQEDKEPLFDLVKDHGVHALAALRVTSSTFVVEAMQAAADSPAATATDLAEYLVAAGMPFRRRLAVVDDLVRESLEGETSLADLGLAHRGPRPDALPLLASGTSVQRRTTRGGAGPQAVADQLVRFRERLTADGARIEAAH